MNLENVCRTCLRIPKHPRQLFEDENDLLKKIETIASVVVANTNELPKQICEDCFTNINNFYSFRKVIINTNLDLVRRLETLKKTNYTSKPRTKIEKSEIEIKTDTQSLHSLTVKNEQELEPQNDMDISDTEYIPESDFSMIKALAMNTMFKCRQCKQIFDSKFKLYNHKRTEHTTPGICNICGTVVRADNLRKHIKLHSDSPCTCEQCGKVFKNSESLRTHKFIHTENSYTCEICGKCFKLKSEHTRHSKLHKDPDFRKTVCSLCGKKVHELKKHIQTHTGERPHACEHCNKGFSSRYALKIHSRQHTNERPYICDHCGYAFPQKVSLTTHLKSKHGIS